MLLNLTHAEIAERISREFPDPERRERVTGMLTGTVFPDERPVDPRTAARVAAHGAVRDTVENYCAEFYDRMYGINPAYMGDGILLRMRQIAADAMMQYDRAFMCGPDGTPPFGITHDQPNTKFSFGIDIEYEWGSKTIKSSEPDWEPNSEIVPLAVVAHRPGERWLIRGRQTFETVAKSLEKEIACELQIVRACVDTLQRAIDASASFNAECPVVRPMTFPFPYGDFVVFAKICPSCWHTFRDRYDIGECRIDSPDEGLG